MVLTADQIKALTGHAVQLHEARDLSELGSCAVEALRAMVGCDRPVVSLATTSLPAVRHVYSPVRGDWDAFANEGLVYAHEDPVYTMRLRLLLDGPGSVTAMMAPAELERTKLYQRVWRPRGIRRLMRYLTPGRFSYRLEAARESGEDFSAADAALVHALGVHLESATARLARDHGGALPVDGRRTPVQLFTWLVSDRAGRVVRSSADANAMMRACLGEAADLKQLPREWVREIESRDSGRPAKPFWYSPAGRSVSVHIAPIRPTRNEFSVGFLEHTGAADRVGSLRGLGLTAREAEVLRWVAEGKTNAEVGVILGISALTAKKHLENVFHRLGVENRTSAVVLAMEAMRRG